jgi:methylphosphotriester-DNA--protein-cysteine methyltransferase
MNGNIYFCDLPHSDKFTLTLFFSLAEREALMVSIRTKAALKAKAERGETWDRKGRETIHKAVAQSARMRVERAKKLLASSLLDITSISLECGFSSLGSFYSAFEAFENITPKKYREDV